MIAKGNPWRLAARCCLSLVRPRYYNQRPGTGWSGVPGRAIIRHCAAILDVVSLAILDMVFQGMAILDMVAQGLAILDVVAQGLVILDVICLAILDVVARGLAILDVICLAILAPPVGLLIATRRPWQWRPGRIRQDWLPSTRPPSPFTPLTPDSKVHPPCTQLFCPNCCKHPFPLSLFSR